MGPTERMSRTSALQFPMKLHVMLEECLTRELDDITAWVSPDGFRIYDKRRFESEVMPLFFRSKTHKVRKRGLDTYNLLFGNSYLNSNLENSFALSFEVLSTNVESMGISNEPSGSYISQTIS